MRVVCGARSRREGLVWGILPVDIFSEELAQAVATAGVRVRWWQEINGAVVVGQSNIGFDELFNRFGEADSKEIFCGLGGLSGKALSRLGIGACDYAMGITSREGLVFRAKLKSRTAFGYYLARNVADTALENTPAGHIVVARAILVNDVAGFAELAAIERRPWELERRRQELVRDEMVFLEAAKE